MTEFDSVEKTIKDWLESDSNKGVKLHERISFLVVCNGGSVRVSGWGFLSHNNGHQVGLEQNEALELIYLEGFISGLELIGVNVYEYHKPYFEDYLKKHGLFKESEE